MVEERTAVEKVIQRMKDHPKWSLVILVGIVIIALGSVSAAIGNIMDLGQRFWPISGSEEATEPKSRPPSAGSSILVTHYPSGELFRVDPITGDLTLISARLGEPSALAVRESGEILVLDAKQTWLWGVDPATGERRDISIVGGIEAFTGDIRAVAMALLSEDAAVVALSDRLVRVDLDTGETEPLVQSGLLKRPSGVTVDLDGDLIVTDLDSGLMELDLSSASTEILADGELVHYPRGPVVDPLGDILFGSGRTQSVLRLKRPSGDLEIVAAGPFVTIAGMALEDEDTLLVADNGHGFQGDGFIARVRLADGSVEKLVSAQSSGWRFLNGRAVAVMRPPAARQKVGRQ